MRISVEISMYPLSGDYVPAIEQFIQRVSGSPAVTAVTNGMSTQLTGDSAAVFDLMSTEMERVLAGEGQTVFVSKILSGDHVTGP
jgi:uncharacterized protein YqgV (UPF0045/DUF77 family)